MKWKLWSKKTEYLEIIFKSNIGLADQRIVQSSHKEDESWDIILDEEEESSIAAKLDLWRLLFQDGCWSGGSLWTLLVYFDSSFLNHWHYKIK